MDPEKQVEDLLKQDGASLVRQNKHLVWQLSNGNTFTQAATPSDHRAAHNQLADLRRALNLDLADRGAPGERRERRHNQGRVEPVVVHPAGRAGATFEEALHASGVVEDSLREKSRQQLLVLEQQSAAIERLREHAVSLVEQRAALREQILWFVERRCWMCEAKATVTQWWRRLNG